MAETSACLRKSNLQGVADLSLPLQIAAPPGRRDGKHSCARDRDPSAFLYLVFEIHCPERSDGRVLSAQQRHKEEKQLRSDRGVGVRREERSWNREPERHQENELMWNSLRRKLLRHLHRVLRGPSSEWSSGQCEPGSSRLRRASAKADQVQTCKIVKRPTRFCRRRNSTGPTNANGNSSASPAR